jgi:hypothetical protein
MIYHHLQQLCKNEMKRKFCNEMFVFSHLQDNLIKRVPRDGSFRRLRSLRILYVFEKSIKMI